MGNIQNTLQSQRTGGKLRGEQAAQAGSVYPGCCGSNSDKILDSFVNLGVYVVEEATHRLLYFNRRFREVCPSVRLGMGCRELMRGPCNNCPLDAMGEQAMTHTVAYSESFGDTLELTATRLLWDGSIPAVMVSVWPHKISAFTDDELAGAKGKSPADYLTGGLNRAGFIDSVERLRGNGVDLTEYAVLFINIKDFKAVNEMLDYNSGNNLLRTLFSRVAGSALHPVVGARSESDHFVFLASKAALNLSELPELLNFHWEYDGTDLFIHCRCGIFNIDDSTLDVYKMIDRAKLAKNHIVDDYVQPYAVFDQSMLEEYSERAEAYFLFDGGMKKQEFHVYYQPVIDAKTGKVVSAEALIRRITADGTVVYPGKFLPMLERTGYISMLDRFVALEVRRFLYSRKEANLPIIPISFNISQKDFYDNSFMNLLTECMETSTLPKGTVLLEITESAYTLNEKKHGEYMTRLRNLGAKILLDDFGTGYSSFGMFKNYCFDRVKLDMSFVRQLSDNKNVRTVVRSIIAMCHELNVEVLAEGVETAEELKLLREMGCDYIQGYYFSKPLDEQSFADYLREHL